VADITPEVGTPLSGFISRENKPSVAVDTPLHVRVLALAQAERVHFMISYELLGIAEPVRQQILAALENGLGEGFSPMRCVLLTTHTHSAPPASPLEGEADPDPAYCQLLAERTVEAARQALQRLAPASLHVATACLPGLTYNRRAVLADGRVSMVPQPELPVVERGAVDDVATLLVWRGEAGACLGSLLHFASHGVAVCTQAIGGDIPGELALRLEEKLGAPCLYLQGATGDVNPLAVAGERSAMLAWVERAMAHLDGLAHRLAPAPAVPYRAVSTVLPLRYQPLPARSTVERNIANLERIAGVDVDSPAVQEAIQLLGNVMNVRAGVRPDPTKAAYAAMALANAERRALAALETGRPLAPCPLRITLWGMGGIVLACVAAELFAVTGTRIRGLSAERMVLPVTHAAPIVGYVPDREAMEKGGYEVDDAWRFYRQPAPFAPDSEGQIVETIRSLLAQV
jgi:hypothetical protein